MGEWSSLIRMAIGALLVVSVIFLGLWVVSVVNPAANAQMQDVEVAVSTGDWDSYNGRVVDRATGKNIARANKERLTVQLGPDPLSADPQTAHTAINNFFSDPTHATRTITITADDNGQPIMGFS